MAHDDTHDTHDDTTAAPKGAGPCVGAVPLDTLLDALPFGAPKTRGEAEAIRRALAHPFEPWELDFRVGGDCVLVYVDRTVIIRRLNRVLGIGGWAFDFEPLVVDGKVLAAKGFLTVGDVTRADIGDSDAPSPTKRGPQEQNKGTVSDVLKRVGTTYEVGAFLTELDVPDIKPAGKNGAFSPAQINDLRKRYAEGRMWKSRGAAAYYGATYVEHGQGDASDAATDDATRASGHAEAAQPTQPTQPTRAATTAPTTEPIAEPTATPEQPWQMAQRAAQLAALDARAVRLRVAAETWARARQHYAEDVKALAGWLDKIEQRQRDKAAEAKAMARA